MGVAVFLLKTWLVLGLGTSILFFLLEACAGFKLGASYTLGIQREIANLPKGAFGKPKRWWDPVFPILWWPPWLALIFRAFANKRTCAAQLLSEIQDAEDRKAALKAWNDMEAAQAAMVQEGRLPIDRTWTVVYKDAGGIAHVSIARYTVPLPGGLRALHVRVTHTIWERSDGKIFICHRAMTAPDKNIPMFAAANKKTAFAWCDDDEEWVALCAPGREDERRAAGLAQTNRLDTGDAE